MSWCDAVYTQESQSLRADSFVFQSCADTPERRYSLVIQCYVFFFFQAEDGIRDHCVTGVQTCALPICIRQGSSDETFSACFVAGAGWAGVSVQHLVETETSHRRDSCHAAARSIHRAGCGSDAAAQAPGNGGAAFQNVAVSCAGRADDDGTGLAGLANT